MLIKKQNTNISVIFLFLFVISFIPIGTGFSIGNTFGKCYAIVEQPLLIDTPEYSPGYAYFIYPYDYPISYSITIKKLEALLNKLFNKEGRGKLISIKVNNESIPIGYPMQQIYKSDLYGQIGEAIYKDGNATKRFQFQVVCFTPSETAYVNLLKPFEDTYYSNLRSMPNTTYHQNLHVHVVDVETGEPVPSVGIWWDHKLLGYTDIYGDINVTVRPGEHIILGLSSTHIGVYITNISRMQASLILPVVSQVHDIDQIMGIFQNSITNAVQHGPDNVANKTWVPVNGTGEYKIVFPWHLSSWHNNYFGFMSPSNLPLIPPVVMEFSMHPSNYDETYKKKYVVIHFKGDKKVYSCNKSSLLKLLAENKLGTTFLILDGQGHVAHNLHVAVNSKNYSLASGLLYYPSTEVVNITHKKEYQYNYTLAYLKPTKKMNILVDGKNYGRCVVNYWRENNSTKVTCHGCNCLWSVSTIENPYTLYISMPKHVFIPLPSGYVNNTSKREQISSLSIPHMQILAIILKRKNVAPIVLPKISSPCSRGWPAHTGEIVTYNEPNFACDLFEVNNEDLSKIVKRIYSKCYSIVTDTTKNSLYSWYIHTYLPQFINTEKLSLRDKLKICSGLYIIQLLSSENGPMKGYFYPEVCCSRTKWCPKRSYFGKCEPKLNIFSKDALDLKCKGPASQYPRGWASDSDMSKNSCILSDMPAHVSINILKTGTCADYSIALTTLLRIAGFSSNEVYTVRGSMHGGHLYNLVRFPGDYKYTIVDTTGNNPFSINLQDIPWSKDYCNYDQDRCANDWGFTKCPPKWEVWGCS